VNQCNIPLTASPSLSLHYIILLYILWKVLQQRISWRDSIERKLPQFEEFCSAGVTAVDPLFNVSTRLGAPTRQFRSSHRSLSRLNGGLVNACTFWMITSASCISLVMPGSVIPTNINRAKIKPTVMFVGVVHAKSSIFNPLSSLLLFYETRNGSNSVSERGEDFLLPPDCLLWGLATGTDDFCSDCLSGGLLGIETHFPSWFGGGGLASCCGESLGSPGSSISCEDSLSKKCFNGTLKQPIYK
jgi:hypothetical protein